eukprot:scaffold250000_cov45-Prasinocladus_malaysianus.AAC.1
MGDGTGGEDSRTLVQAPWRALLAFSRWRATYVRYGVRCRQLLPVPSAFQDNRTNNTKLSTSIPRLQAAKGSLLNPVNLSAPAPGTDFVASRPTCSKHPARPGNGIF